MQKEQKTYTKEFKVEAVHLLESSQKSQAQIARDLGVADSKDLADHGHDAFPGSGHQTPLEEENRHLKREVEVLRQEREILKKAISIFSRGQG
jgi:transposase